MFRPIEVSAGVAADKRRTVAVNDRLGEPRLRELLRSQFGVFQLICLPLVSGADCFGVMVLFSREGRPSCTPEDLELLGSMAGLVAISLERFRAHRRRADQQQLERELDDARKVQDLLLPGELPRSPRFEVASKYAQASRVGGDYYDVIGLDRGLAVVLADVSGHDIGAAMLMAMGRSVVRMILGVSGDSAVPHAPCVLPGELLGRTNDVLAVDTPSERFVSMAAAILDHGTGTVCYSNAGGPFPLLLRRGSARIVELTQGGLPLGVLGGQTYADETLALDPGDLLAFYTDGLEEARSLSGELFGVERIESLLISHRDRPTQDLVDTMYQESLAFTEQGRFQDDFTLVVVRAR